MKLIKKYITLLLLLSSIIVVAQTENSKTYKKRVLESVELDILNSYYTQDGDNAAVTGGIGTEELDDLTATIIVAIPLNDDDILTIDAGVSAYSSASSSNINPFDAGSANPFIASSGESQSDTWGNLTASYSHSSDDRNKNWNANISFSTEYDYTSIGFGVGYAQSFNQKNTELSVNASAYIDTWNAIYPYELKPSGGEDDEEINFDPTMITGNPNYNPSFTPFNNKGRNSYNIGFGFSQILSKNMQMSLNADFVLQDGLLSTPFQRVHFSDVADSFFQEFHLADDVERLPNSRFKTALGTQVNYYINEYFTIRSFYRYYFDNWNIKSHTMKVEVPIKITDKFTLYPSYRFYSQTAAAYFKPYNQHLSTSNYYTSDYDLSKFNANQYGFGISYTDIFTKAKVWKLGLKQIDVKFYQYDRNTTFNSSIITTGIKFVLD